MGSDNLAVVPERLELWPIEDLNPYDRNPRTHSIEQVEQIKNSISEFGFTNPILVDKDKGVIAGHGRLQASKLLGLKRVPVIVLDHLSEAQRKAYVIADNQLALNSGWDLDLLRDEIESLNDLSFGLDVLGFEDGFLDELLTVEGDEEEEGSIYTSKSESPIYEPREKEKPKVSDLADLNKCKEILDRIYSCPDLPDDIKGFLVVAAYRHVTFNFQTIAEFYAHSEEKIRSLMRESALVVVDTEKALAEGWLRLGERLSEIYEADFEAQQNG